MPLKEPRKLKTKSKVAHMGLEELLRTAHDVPKGVAVINSAAKLTKALKISTNTADSERLIRLIKRSMEVSEIPAYVQFIKEEWHNYKGFVPKYGVRGITEAMPFTLGSLCQYHTLLTSLFNTYTDSVAEYKKRLGYLDSWEASIEKVKEDPQAEVRRLKQELADIKSKLITSDEQLKITSAELTGYTESYRRARRFAIFFQKYINSTLSEDDMLDFLEDGKVPESMAKSTMHYLFG